MTERDLLAALYAKRPQVIKPGLARMEAAFAALRAGPEELRDLEHGPALRIVVGGTNGKGTTSAYLFQLLAAAGVETGLYTSPHLVSFEERVQTSHRHVSLADALATLEELRAALPPALYDELSFFEVTTIAALARFRAEGTRVDVLEVGLGGRWDSTNAVDPAVSVVTSIGLDHQELLGDTTAAIAREKAGIFRAGRPAIWAGRRGGDAAADQAIREEAARRGAVLWDGDDVCREAGSELRVTLPTGGEARVVLPRRLAEGPPFLRRNFQLALVAFVEAHRRLAPTVTVAEAVQSFAAGHVPPAASLTGRFQSLAAAPSGEPPRDLLLDVCHNVAGAQAFVEGLAARGLAGAPALVSVFGDKDVNGILDVLRPALGEIHLYPQKGERAWTHAHLAERHQGLAWHESLADAWRAAPRGPLVLCGSVHGIGETLAFLGLDGWGQPSRQTDGRG